MKNRLTRWLATISTTLFAGMTFTGMAFTGMVMAQELGPGHDPWEPTGHEALSCLSMAWPLPHSHWHLT